MKSYILVAVLSVFVFGLIYYPRDEPENMNYQVKLKMKEVNFYGETIRFEPSDTTFIIANTGNVTEINLGNGSPFGVKAHVFPIIGDTAVNHVYQIVFYEKVFDEWKNFNSEETLQRIKLNKKRTVSFNQTSGGAMYFRMSYDCFISEL